MILASACGSDLVAPADFDGISFDYSGEVSGHYETRGIPTRTNAAFLNSTNYASAVTYPASITSRAGTLSIIANDKSGAKYGNFLLLSGLPTQGGTVTFAGNKGGALSLGLTWDEFGLSANTQFSINSGQATITEVTGARVRGTFSGTGVFIKPSDGTTTGGGFDPSRTISITNGKFNVALNDTASVAFRCSLFAC